MIDRLILIDWFSNLFVHVRSTAYEISVIDNVVMAERCTFGIACCAL